MACMTMESPVGPLVLTAAGGALIGVSWGTAPREDDDPLLRDAVSQLCAYFTGERTTFELPLRPAGTTFRQRVWRAMLDIPYGGTATYGAIAQALDTAPRAVGGACGANPIPIIIPCHRVLAGGGKPGGYSGAGGLDTKSWLLGHEARAR